jgi:hypothetical protein
MVHLALGNIPFEVRIRYFVHLTDSKIIVNQAGQENGHDKVPNGKVKLPPARITFGRNRPKRRPELIKDVSPLLRRTAPFLSHDILRFLIGIPLRAYSATAVPLS